MQDDRGYRGKVEDFYPTRSKEISLKGKPLSPGGSRVYFTLLDPGGSSSTSEAFLGRTELILNNFQGSV